VGRIRKFVVEGYRSVCHPIEVNMPDRIPLVLIGENNAGKSNLVRALDLVLGEFWPGNYEPEDHEFYGRDRSSGLIKIEVSLNNVTDTSYGRNDQVNSLVWQVIPGDPDRFKMTYGAKSGTGRVNGLVRDQCTCILVSADRRLSYQLGYSSKYTALSKLTKKFHDALSANAWRVDDLKNQYGKVVEVFHEVEEFVDFQDELKRQIADLSGNLAYSLGIDFSPYDPSNYFRSLRVQPAEGGAPRTFEELGTGQEQVLAICFIYAYAKAFHNVDGLILMIEEPEAHLHPLAQHWLAEKIREIAAQGVQIVVTTHSPAFLDVLSLSGIVRVFKGQEGTETIQLTARDLAKHCLASGAEKTSESTVLPFYAAAATEEILAGLFARKVVLVEGPTEALALPIYLARVGLHPTREGIAFIPVGGVNSLPRWWRFFTAYEVPCYVIFDNDSESGKQRVGQEEVLRTIGLSEDDIGWLADNDDWIADDAFCSFGVDFESTLRQWFDGSYEELEREASNNFGLDTRNSKPLRARFIAERLSLDNGSIGWGMLHELAQRIMHLGSSEETHSVVQQTVDEFDDEFDDVPFD